MSRTRNAALSTVFAYSQYALAIVSGFVLFPVIVKYVGAHDYGLWLVSGELVGYLLLGDFGVFAILPWLVAAKDGGGDRGAIGEYLANALAVGIAVGLLFGLTAIVVWWMTPEHLSLDAANWSTIREPLALLLALTGFGLPFRAYTAIVMGLQDVSFGGWIALVQSALVVGLTAAFVLMGFRLTGLAVATGLPPLVMGMVAAYRVFARFPEVTTNWRRPSWNGCRHLFGQGVGAWLGSLGVRLLTASNGLVFAALGRPDWATIYAATGKVAQVAQPICGVLPDSGLVGLSQQFGENDRTRVQRTVLCMLLLYLVIPGFVAVGLLIANQWFVRTWMGPDFFAGTAINVLISASLVFGGAGGGLFKVVGVVGYRRLIGFATVVAGGITIVLGYALGLWCGMTGVALASVIASAGVIFPVGIFASSRVFGISAKSYVVNCLGTWTIRTISIYAIAGWLGWWLYEAHWTIMIPIIGILLAFYVLAIRGVLISAPWPTRIQQWLFAIRILPTPR